LKTDPFGSPETFRETFASGLERLLQDEEGLGPFILVLANACFDPSIHHRLRHRLARRFGELAESCRRAFVAGRQLREPEDDMSVFLKLMAIGFDHIEPARSRTVGSWELQFNQIRSLRPRRAAGIRPASIRVPFDPRGFQFNKPFLRKETFWWGTLAGETADLLYNKFPFVELHALLVPDRQANHPQYLTAERHLWAWRLAEQLAPRLPGVLLAYNAYGACASVNHLHFQLSVRDTPLPVASGQWRHNGGPTPYPACCERYSDPDTAWDRLDELHRRGNSYNLVYLPGQLYCLPRGLQGTYDLPPWCGGQAWYELAGGVVTFNADDFQSLRVADLDAALEASAAGLCK
jgi:hypothetical protein